MLIGWHFSQDRLGGCLWFVIARGFKDVGVGFVLVGYFLGGRGLGGFDDTLIVDGDFCHKLVVSVGALVEADVVLEQELQEFGFVVVVEGGEVHHRCLPIVSHIR